MLKKYWREAAILILFVVCFISMRSCRNQRELASIGKNKTDSAFLKADSVRLKNGELAFRVSTLEVTNKQLKESGILDYLNQKKLQGQIGDMSRLVTIYRGQVESNGTFISIAHDTVIVEVIKKDTVKVKEKAFKWTNGYLSLIETYNPLTEALNHKYLYRADFQLVSYRKGANFFRRGTLVSDITFSDPNLRIGEFQGVVVKEPPAKRFSVGPMVGYDLITNKPTIGISVQWGIIHF